jgi:hypothetical protein
MLELTVFLLILLPGVLLTLRNSSYLVDYTVLVFVFNREIRRLVDYHNQEFNPFSLISLTPLLISGLIFVGFICNFQVLQPRAKQIFLMLLAAIGYGAAVGVVQNGFASVYQSVEYLAPVGLMGYAAVSPADDKTADRWLRTAGFAGVLAALYGWYQYLTIPEWDAFRVRQVNFVGYLGKLEPTQMLVFSTFAERGPCASYLALVAIPMLVLKRWRVFSGWPDAVLVLSVIFLTFARTGIVLTMIGVALFPILNRGRKAARIIITAALVCGILLGISSGMPGADRIKARFETLSHVQDDGSFNGRLLIAHDSFQNALTHPAGFGIGSSGVAEKLTGRTEGIAADNGWIELLSSLGVPGFLLYAGALAFLWRYFSVLERFGVQDDYLTLARTFFLASLIVMWIGNFFIDFSVMWIAWGRALSPMVVIKTDPEMRELLENASAEAAS